MDIYQADSARYSKCPLLFTDTEVTNDHLLFQYRQHKFNSNSQLVILFSDKMGFTLFFLQKPPGGE